MNSKGLLQAHLCLTTATTAFFAGTVCGHATASHTHILKHGETIEFLGRHYHVALKDLLAANHLSADDILRDGRSLYIPDAPHPTNVPPTMRKASRIKGDRISIRIGPASSRRRVHLCDNGTKLVVTAERNGWLQVTLDDGRAGWVRSDFVHHAGKSASANIVHNIPKRKNAAALPLSAARAGHGAERLRLQHAHEGRANKIAHKPHEARHPLHEVSEQLREKHDEAAGARLRRHQENIARARHERHVMEMAAAKLHAHKAEVAAHHRAAELAGAHLHQKHMAEIKEATHRKHLKELAEAKRHNHLKEIAAARQPHGHEGGTEALHKKHLAEIAAAKHSKHLREISAGGRRQHEEEMAHARRQKHLDEIAAARHRQHLEALAAIYRHHLAALANHQHRAEVAAARQHDTGHYTHKIRPEAESPSASNDVVRSAFAYRGTPYRWGEARPGGFDCSGFTKYIYGRKGVSLPRTAAEQFHAGSAVTHHGMKPGDLVFFHTTRSGISHVGMYVGSGKFVHSSSKKAGGVRVDNLDSGYYSKAFRGARRVRKDISEGSGE